MTLLLRLFGVFDDCLQRENSAGRCCRRSGKPVPTYVPELRGSAWEQATVRNVMIMSNGLDTEETMENLMNPESWIANWFTSAFELNKGDFRQMPRNAKPLPGESAGEHFRFCRRRNTQ